MCGRYVLQNLHWVDYLEDPELKRRLEITTPVQEAPRYNVAPSTQVPVFIQPPDSHSLQLELCRWDLIPSYTQDLKTKYSMINLRTENVLDPKKSYWHRLLSHQRCLIPASHFYEWQAGPYRRKIPFAIHRSSSSTLHSMMTFAGIYDHWRSPEGEDIRSVAIITCRANPLLESIHNKNPRMPVILIGEDQLGWLDLEPAAEYLQPLDEKHLQAYPVGAYVNSVRNQGPECLKSLDAPRDEPENQPASADRPKRAPPSRRKKSD